jgi:hypothetical protein
MAKPAWKEELTWFLIAEKDHMFAAETQRLTAERMKCTTVSLPVNHAPLR